MNNDMELIDKDTETLVAFLCGKLNEDGTYQISSNVKIIGSYAFCSCLKLKSVTLHDKLQTVGEYAFDSTGLVSVDIPASVESIGNYDFSSCKSLSTLTIEEGMKKQLEIIFYMILLFSQSSRFQSHSGQMIS